MKKLYPLLIIFIFFSNTLMGQSTSQSPKESDFKSGIFTYKIDGTYEKGVEVQYIDGIKQCTHRTTEVLVPGTDFKTKEETLTINDGEYVYSINLGSRTGTKTEAPQKMMEKYNEDEREALVDQAYKTLTQELSPTIEKTQILKNKNGNKKKITFFGRPCTIVVGPNFKTYIWKNIILRQEIKKPFKILKEITDIKLNETIPPEKFVPPTGVHIIDFDTGNLGNIIKQLQEFKKNNQNKNS